MGKQYKYLKEKDIEFIKEQKLFYIASCSSKEVNLSPKGYDTIRVLDEKTIAFANYPGSGNRTFRDAEADGEFTLVFNAFEGPAQILRIFCKAEIVKCPSKEFDEIHTLFNIKAGLIRDIFKFNIYAVESSCGASVPIMEYKEDRNALIDWVENMHKNDKLEDYKKKRHNPPNLTEL
ncbi:MAG: pyridoxamine 5'-phosphate oxidase family protein [Thiovulaceae bacterium]|nr:pyridoxamine 5'-phosphate oxidase family protein [Sulfurimonadaceae bacterium]